jgi:hypothetical protein
MQLFERRIRPVLVQRCYACHSAQAGKEEAGLRLDSADGLRHGADDGPVIILTDPPKSRLIQVMRKAHPAGRMPPNAGLSRSVIGDFEAWVRMGAPDPRASSEIKPSKPAIEARKHWAFQSLSTPALPSVRQNSWVKDSLDTFVLARHEQLGLKIPPQADRITLIRRATFDLTGLPPTPQEVDDFVADKAPGAFSRVVDRLLGSVHFGEHWGRHWLELVHYADLGSLELNAVHENAWRYRDYVMGALNADMPYDRFIREQLAGDLLPTDEDEKREHELIVATGFLTVGPRLAVEPNRPRLALEIADEQVELTTRVFLGLTVACAHCHDHKTDPISQRDYYALAGIFSSTASLAESAEGMRRDTPRWLERSLATTEQLREVSEFESRFTELKEKLQEAREMKIAFPGEIDSSRLAGVVVDNLAAEVHGAWKESNYSTNFVDRNYLHDGDSEKGRKSARFVPNLPRDGIYEVMVSYTPRANRATNVPVTISGKAGPKTVYVNQTLSPTVDKVFTPVGKFAFAAGTSGSVTIANEGTKGFVVVDAVRFVPVDEETTAGAAAPQTADPEAALLNYHQLEKEVLEFRTKRPVIPQAMAVQEGQIRDCKLRTGGDPDRPAEDVPRGFLSALGTPDSTAYDITDESSGRLELANWVVNRDNPLPARVAVNRIWSHLFGEGLVSTTDDFGVGGARPSDPALLDHLAHRFVEQGWSIKKLIRAIMLSSTYQMSSPGPADTAVGVQLALHVQRRTLGPEVLRDAMLAVSHDLDPAFGGTWMPTNRATLGPVQSARRAQTASRRRTVYLPVIRNSTPEILRGLAAPLSNPALGQRQGSSSATSPVSRFTEQCATAWADALQQGSAANDARRVTLAYREALGRLPSDVETTKSLRALSAPKPGDLEGISRAWELFCTSLLTSKPFRELE